MDTAALWPYDLNVLALNHVARRSIAAALGATAVGAAAVGVFMLGTICLSFDSFSWSTRMALVLAWNGHGCSVAKTERIEEDLTRVHCRDGVHYDVRALIQCVSDSVIPMNDFKVR